MKRNVKRLSQYRSIQPLMRAVTVITAVAVLTTGVTFAALQSQQVALTGNTLQTATAGLQIGTSAASFATSRAGFTFKDIIPGGPAAPAVGNDFYLKNSGTATLTLKAAVSTTPVNSGNVNLSKVYVVFTRVDANTTQKIALSTLVSGYATGGTALTETLAGNGTVAQYKMQVSMDADAFTGTDASITGIDVVFTGIAISQ